MRRAALLALLLLSGAALARGPAPTAPVPRTVKWWHTRHAQITERLKQGDVELIFLGDSITAGWERNGADVWQTYYGKRHAVNMGIGGDETGHLLWRLQRSPLDKIKPKVLVLLIGVNNAFRRDHDAAAIAAGVKAVVATLRRRLPRTKILLLGIFPAGGKPNKVRKKTLAVNRKIKGLADGKRVRYLDIGDRFLEGQSNGAGGRSGQEDGRISQDVMFDYLHLTEKGYRIWAEALEPTLKELLGEK
jgi:beta-glucosidase